jgi:hypothetical protein
MIVWRLYIACCIPKAADTLLEYVTLIVFPVQKWLHESAAVIPCTYIVRLAHFTCSTIGLTKAKQLLQLVSSARCRPGRNMLRERMCCCILPCFMAFDSVSHTVHKRERERVCVCVRLQP